MGARLALPCLGSQCTCGHTDGSDPQDFFTGALLLDEQVTKEESEALGSFGVCPKEAAE